MKKSAVATMSETENFKIKERKDGLTQERVNRETKSLWYIIKDFLEELYSYIKNNKTERRMGIPGVYSKSGTGMIREKPE